MRVTSTLIVTGLALAVTGCSTTTNNPNYQHSTLYKGSTPSTATVQQASYQTQTAAPITYAPQQASYTQVNQECLSKESDRKIIGTLAGGAVGAFAGRKIAGDKKTLGTVAGAAIGGAAGYGIADKTIDCDPISVPATQTQQTAVITPAYQPAPTVYTPAPTVTTQRAAEGTAGIQENVNSLGEQGTPGYYAVNGTPDYAQAPEPVRVYAPQPTPTLDANISSASATNIRHTLKTGDTVYSLARTSCVSVAEFKQLNSIDDQYYIRVGDEILLPAGRCTQ